MIFLNHHFYFQHFRNRYNNLKAYNEYLKTIVYLIVTLFNVFLVASLSLRFVFPLISLEGEALWKIRSAPIDFNDLLSKDY